MPELPEVEAVCERLRQQSRNATIDSFHVQHAGVIAPQSPATVAAHVADTRIEAVRRRGTSKINPEHFDAGLQPHSVQG